MAKYFVPPTARTPADRVRQTLDEAEIRMSNIRRAGPQVLELLHLFDQTADTLVELEELGVDVRAERSRFETIQHQIRGRQRRFLAEAGVALLKERAAVQPARERWWWFLDEALADQRARGLRRTLIGVVATAALLAVVWLAYDRFLAPPAEVREAFQRTANGESLVEAGDLRAALAEFEAAAALDPEDPQPWLWQGVIYSELDKSGQSQTAFDMARSLSETDLDFLLGRSMTYLRAKNVAAARADAEQAVRENPSSGYAYYLRANVATEEGDYAAAVADLDKAAELAQAAGNTQLEATARTQRAMVIQLQVYQQITPTP